MGLEVPDAELVVGELVANALMHARSRYTVTVCDDEGILTIEVADRDVRLPTPIEIGPSALSGRGLSLVARLADAWGVRSDLEGKVVWAELAAPERTTS